MSPPSAVKVLDLFSDERDRWALWLPVLIGIGIAIYFAWPSEPPLWPTVLILVASLIAAGAGRTRTCVLLPSLIIALMALGFAAASLRTMAAAAPVLERPSGAVQVEGTVGEIELLPEGGARMTLDAVSVPIDGPAPTRVRLRLRDSHPIPQVGDRVSVRASLMPPMQPAAPGAFDFARFAWFYRLGATGMALGPPEVQPSTGQLTLHHRWRLAWNGLRQAIFTRIMTHLSGDEGGVSVALITGEMTGISGPVLAAYRDSGLAHILSISGLHMSLAAGLAFFFIRGALALIPPIALRHPIKKWAAAAALLLTWVYLMLSGAPVPAERSFYMAGLVLVAILLDRSAISLRLWAWAAIAVLLFEPEEMIGPSFQMSFAAVLALIATYEVAAPHFAELKNRYRGWMADAGLYVSNLLLSSLVAGCATAVYGLYHFNRVAVWSVAANLIAVPLTGVAVMPFAMAALLLMPFGLEWLPLIPLGWGVAAVNWIAFWVAGWPSAAITVPVMPLWGMLVFTLGGLWLCLWRRLWRLGGLAVMAVGLGSMAFSHPPDLLIDSRGQAFAVRSSDGSLLMSKAGKILRDTWARRAGPVSTEWWPKQGRSRDGRLACDREGCLYRTGSHIVALVKDEDGIAAACNGPDVVVSAVPIRDACRGAKVVVDRFDLWRRGAHVLWVEGETVRLLSVADWQGDRPWSHKARPKKKKMQSEETVGVKPEIEGEEDGGR